MTSQVKIVFAVSLIALAALSRLVEHPFNFTPVAAISIFAGFYLRSWYGALIPMAAMLGSDYFLGFYEWPVMIAVYGSILISYLIGRYLNSRNSWQNYLIAPLASSLIFFFITNFSIWAFFDWYPHTWSGLTSCFTLALPFYRNTFLGDMMYAGVFFGIYELAAALYRSKKLEVRS